MYNEKTLKFTGRAGRICLMLLCACMASIASAQDAPPTVNEVEVRAGARGMILTIGGTGPITVDIPGTPAAKYPELRITVNNARFALGSARNFSGPQELPIDNVSVSETKEGVLIVIKMRGLVNGPIDTRASNNQARILMTKDALPEVVWPVVAKDAAPAVAQTDITTEPIDMKKMQERAARDTQPRGDGEVFTVSKQQPAARPAAAPQITPTRSETPAVTQETLDIVAITDSEVVRKTPEGTLVRYKVYGRDPFVPLMRDTTLTDLPRVENLRLVGVLEDTFERIALVEDHRNNNRAFALRTNDPVEFGKVLRVHRDKVVFLIRDFDVSRSYTLSLTNR